MPKPQTIKVQIYDNEPASLYKFVGMDTDTYDNTCYFICLDEDAYPCNKYIRMGEDQFKDKNNKKNMYKLVYSTDIDMDSMFDTIRHNMKK